MKNGLISLLPEQDLIVLGILYIIPIVLICIFLIGIDSTLRTIAEHLKDIYYEVEGQGQKKEEPTELNK